MPPFDRRRRRSHELGPDRIDDRAVNDADNLIAFLAAQAPSDHFIDRIELVRTTRAPKSRGDCGFIQHPSQREVDDSFFVELAGELVQALDRFEVLSEARLLELGVGAAQIVATKNRSGVYPPAQQAAAD